MIALLPDPQEVRFLETPCALTGRERVFLSPWKGDDATLEILLPALRRFSGRAPKVVEERLPGKAGAALAIAGNARKAADLARRAAAQLKEPVPTATVWRDGPYMRGEGSWAREIAPGRDHSIGRDETYVLLIAGDGIAVAGSGRRGMFWGVQTLLQVLTGSKRPRVQGLVIRDWPTQQLRGVHADMKYFYQKPSALEQWLKGLSGLKLNCALFEYEDKFPFAKYPFLRDRDAMSPARLRKVLETARRYHITVIPLVQSLGHLEFALRHEELAHLREAPDIHTQACPTNPESLRFVCDLIDEVMAFHPDTPVFHIGGDETGFLGECPRCARAAKERGEIDLYLDHITRVLRHVIGHGKRPILWEDIVRVRPDAARRIPRETILAYWDYGQVREKHFEREINPGLASFYRTGRRSAETWPDTLSIFEFFDFYRRKGFDVLAMPCLNYGTLAPSLPATWRNTSAFAEKASVCGGMGTINTQWACFKIPFDGVWYGCAMTAQSSWFWPPCDTADFDAQFSRLWLGMPDSSLVNAGNMIAEGIGFRAGGGRPFNLLHYAIMDAELNYDKGMDTRRRLGSSTRAIDVVRVVRQKLKRLAAKDDRGDVDARTVWVEAQVAAALALLKGARPGTAVGRRLHDLLAVSGRFKLNRIQTMRLLRRAFEKRGAARPQKDEFAKALRAERRLRRELSAIYGRYLTPAQLEHEIHLLFDGEVALLENRLEGKR